MLYKTIQVPTPASIRQLQGGAISSITLPGALLPANSTIVKAWVDVLTTLDSAAEGASVAIKVGAVDLVAAAAEASWGAGFVAGIQTGASVAGLFKITADAPVLLVITGEALTSGKCNVYVEYVETA